MKSVIRTLKPILAVICSGLSALYIVFYFLNGLTPDDFFRTYVHKTVFLVLTIFVFLCACLIIAGNREKKRRRLNKKRRRNKDTSRREHV